jgi:hypothetical protein
VNPEKMDTTENIVGHGMFGLLSMMAFYLVGVAISNNSPATKQNLASSREKKYQ